MAARITRDTLWPAIQVRRHIVGAFLALGILSTILTVIGLVYEPRLLAILHV